MGELLSELDAGVVLGTIGVLVGVVGILLFLRSRKRKEPVWASVGTSLVGPPAADYGQRLKVTFDGEEVGRVTVTKVYFWNAGNDIIESSDLQTVDPLRVVLTEERSRILDCVVVAQARPVVNAQKPVVSDERQEAVLRFDFLETGDGLTVDVIHSASKPEAVRVAGTIKGSKPPAHEESPAALRRKPSVGGIAPAVLQLGVAVAMFWGLLYMLQRYSAFPAAPLDALRGFVRGFSFFAVAMVILSVALLLIAGLGRRVPDTLRG